MCSRFRSEVCAAIALAALCGACDREHREYNGAPEQANAHPSLTTLQPGARLPEGVSELARHYESNAYHITQGGRWYKSFNCAGCHGAGGGGNMGPAFLDDQWRYGGNMDQIHASILEGRPNGMPAWRGKLTDAQAWQLSAYIRAMSGNVRKDAAPSRREGMSAAPPMTQVPEQPPRTGDTSATNPPPP